MKTFEERAREWLDIQDEELVATTSFRVLLVMFARMLDQEAQEKCCVLCDGKDCGHLHHQDKPQQLEKIGCPPHNLIPYTFHGTWGGSIPPPNMKCTKCLMETRF